MERLESLDNLEQLQPEAPARNGNRNPLVRNAEMVHEALDPMRRKITEDARVALEQVDEYELRLIDILHRHQVTEPVDSRFLDELRFHLDGIDISSIHGYSDSDYLRKEAEAVDRCRQDLAIRRARRQLMP